MMNRAVFLDRDGVINHPKKNYYVFHPDDFHINKGVVEALLQLQERGFLLFVITNQGGISKGKYSRADVEKLHDHMEAEFGRHGIHFSGIYYCPHHPKHENCLCRKPEPLMLQKAMARFGVDPAGSWFIGDRKSDVQAGQRAGVQTIRIFPNRDLRKIIKKII